MKTPEQVAAEVAAEYDAHIFGSPVESLVRLVAERAIEADRAQPRYLLISEHDDAGVIGLYHSRQDAIDAATANCDNDPDVWGDYYSVQEV